MKRLMVVLLFALLSAGLMAAKDSVHVKVKQDTLLHKTDSLITDSIPQLPRNLLDSLGRPELLRHYFFLHEKISGQVVTLQTAQQSRDLPRLKSIRLRKVEHDQWKFWILLITVLFLAIVRLMNVKRFNEIMATAFDMHTDVKTFAEKSGNYIVMSLALFLNFILSLSLFLTNFLERNHLIDTNNFYLLFWQFCLVLLVVYLAKTLLNLIIGSIFGMRSLSLVTLFNTFVVNNLLGVAMVLLNLFYVFVDDSGIANITSAVIMVVLLIAVIYRQIMNLFMASQSGRFQFIYIFLYLCALEILPWLVLFKMFLNNW